MLSLARTRLSSQASSANALRAFSTSHRMEQTVNTLTVFGAGLMGAGIVQVAAANGVKVIMTDVSEDALKNGRNIITKSLTRIARKKFPDSPSDQEKMIQSTFNNIKTTTSAQEAVQSTDLVIEAIVENLKVKQELFQRLDELADESTMFATNTSSLSIANIANLVSEARKAKFAGFHAFNPVPQMKLVEIVQAEKTSDETKDSLLELCKRMGKTPVHCKDTPGFVVNRLLVPYMLEAIRLVERGEATAGDVDIAMKLGAGLPMGPLELADFVGLDTLAAIAQGWRQERVSTGEISSAAVAEVKMLDDLVKSGKKGRKSGEGFFKY